jgi:hypothetical protein
MKDLLARPVPSVYELLLIIPIALLLTSFVAVIDATIFDGYVLPDLAECYGTNLSDRCLEIWDRLGCEVGDQRCVGDNYWLILESIVIVFGILLFVLRMFMGIMAGAKLTPMLFFIGFMWFVSGAILFYFGWIDLLYYEVRGLDVPVTLDWLDNVGLFTYIQHLGNTESVDKSDLYLLNILGLVTLIGVWLKLMYLHHKKHLRRIGIKH